MPDDPAHKGAACCAFVTPESWNPSIYDYTDPCPQSRIPRRWPGNPFSARHQSIAQGNAASGGQAADPVRRGRGLRGRHPGHDLVTGRSKRAIEDHFDTAYELENELENAGKQAMLDLVRSVSPDDMNCLFVRQPRSLGLGHAVLCAEPLVGNEPFAVLLADDLMTGVPGGPGVMAQMTAAFSSKAARCSPCRKCRWSTPSATASSRASRQAAP